MPWLVVGDTIGMPSRPGQPLSSPCWITHQSKVPSLPNPTARRWVGFTSGTTQDPKGVVHSHRTIGFESRQLDYMFPGGGPPQITGAPSGIS